MNLRQHPKVALLQQSLHEAREHGDLDAERDALNQLKRIEIRPLSADQLDAQAQYIASQCDQARVAG